MALRPSRKPKNILSQSLDGVYGVFKTTESFTLSYLLTNLRAAELLRLQTASEAFDFRNISFEELMQRDVDYERVDNEIINKYLEQGKNHALFFPPLLVTVVTVDDGERVDSYDSVTFDLDEPAQSYTTTWGDDKFQLELCLEEKATGHKFAYEGKTYNYLPYASSLRYNPQAVKLVVIDGQHRFVALRRIYESEEKRMLLQEMEIPICVFFMPDAVKNNPNAESIVRDLRELFITINSKAKEVSGHFLVLLNDRSLSSHCVRHFADSLRRPATNGTGSLLPLLEWNTRESRKASQRQKKYSITTVSVIADALEKYVLCRKDDGVPQLVLNLASVQKKLKVSESSYAYSAIEESTFNPEQIEILGIQIDKYITPSLRALFLMPRPYESLLAKYSTAISKLDKLVVSKVTGAEQFRDNVLFQFRRTTDRDLPAVRDVEGHFEKDLFVDPDDEPYFYNVFQQGLIRAWAELCIDLVGVEPKITPQVVAGALAASSATLVFNEKRRMFQANRPYLQGMLFSGERVLVNETSRLGWMLLILATLLTNKARKEFTDALTAEAPEKKWLAQLDDKLIRRSRQSISKFFEDYERRLSDDFSNNWRYKNLGKADLAFLTARENDESKEDEFQKKLSELVGERVHAAKDGFANILDMPTKKVFQRGK